MPLDVASFDPPSFWLERERWQAAALVPTGIQAALLHPHHPFLLTGTWRAFVALRDGAPVAHLVASLDPRQLRHGTPVGAIGFVAAGDDRGALATALAAAVGWLRAAGAGAVRCPVQLSTWFGHRTVTAGAPAAGGAPPFVFEPAHAPHLDEVLRHDGFAPAHRAVSLLVPNDRPLAHGPRLLSRLRAAGYGDRPIDPARFDDEVRLFHRLACAIFRDNWGFGEVSAAEVVAFYTPAAPLVDHALVRVVERGGVPVGFVFALPENAGRPALGPAPPRFVVKTIGVLPEERRRCPGIGAALAALVHGLAQERGYRVGIHALMTEGSVAHRTSSHWGTWLRSYATFERPLP